MSEIVLNPIYENIIDELADQKYSITDNFFTAEETALFRAHVMQQYAQEQYEQAAIGNSQNEKIVQSVRGDLIKWIDEETKNDVEEIFFNKVNEFISYLNQTCYMGIEDSEFHYAVYNQGTFYQRHIDAFKNDDRRTLSMVFYLNDEDWKDEFGGQLGLYLPNEDGTERELNVLPVAGRMAIFDSKTIPHEVKMVNRTRYSITGWLKTRSLKGF